MIWVRKWDEPRRYWGYKVHLSVFFLDIAGENDKDFDTEGGMFCLRTDYTQGNFVFASGKLS